MNWSLAWNVWLGSLVLSFLGLEFGALLTNGLPFTGYVRNATAGWGPQQFALMGAGVGISALITGVHFWWKS